MPTSGPTKEPHGKIQINSIGNTRKKMLPLYIFLVDTKIVRFRGKFVYYFWTLFLDDFFSGQLPYIIGYFHWPQEVSFHIEIELKHGTTNIWQK